MQKLSIKSQTIAPAFENQSSEWLLWLRDFYKKDAAGGPAAEYAIQLLPLVEAELARRSEAPE